MKCRAVTYKTLTGTKEIVEFPEKKSGQWVVYQNNIPKYFVDCFDFKTESNLILNYLILSQQKTIDEILKSIRKSKKINISVPKPPLVEIKLKTELKEIKLIPLPENWLY